MGSKFQVYRRIQVCHLHYGCKAIVTGETENETEIKTENIMKQAQDWFAANPFLINLNKV